MNDIYRLVYTSRNLLAGSEDVRVAAVAGILAASQRNNARIDVTGALLFNGGSFAQVLEGPRASVEATFERIQRDPRHSDVAVLQCESVAERGFPHWSMSFIGHSARGRALWTEIASRTGFDLGRMEGDTLFATLHAIVMEEEGVDATMSAASAPASSVPAMPLPEQPRTEPARRGGPERVVEQLDVARLRSELGAVVERAAEPPAPAGAAPLPRAAVPAGGTGAEGIEIAVLRAALVEERARTGALRRDLDEARIGLAISTDKAEAAARRGDLWAERARALAAALCREPDEEAPPIRRVA